MIWNTKLSSNVECSIENNLILEKRYIKSNIDLLIRTEQYRGGLGEKSNETSNVESCVGWRHSSALTILIKYINQAVPFDSPSLYPVI